MPRLQPDRAGRLVAWGNALLAGRTSLDDAADGVRGADGWHRVDGLPADDDLTLPVALGRLTAAGVVGFRLALPVPGDVSHLPGPVEFNADALAVGEAVLLDGIDAGLIPTELPPGGGAVPGEPGRIGVRWRFLPTSAAAPRGPSLAEAERTLAVAVREATELLADLDVAGMGPETAAALTALRSGPVGSALAPGYPDRAHEVLRRARWLSAVVAIATEEDGRAVSSFEMTARRRQLTSVAAAAREAIVAAHNAPTEATSGEGSRSR